MLHRYIFVIAIISFSVLLLACGSAEDQLGSEEVPQNVEQEFDLNTVQRQSVTNPETNPEGPGQRSIPILGIQVCEDDPENPDLCPR